MAVNHTPAAAHSTLARRSLTHDAPNTEAVSLHRVTTTLGPLAPPACPLHLFPTSCSCARSRKRQTVICSLAPPQTPTCRAAGTASRQRVRDRCERAGLGCTQRPRVLKTGDDASVAARGSRRATMPAWRHVAQDGRRCQRGGTCVAARAWRHVRGGTCVAGSLTRAPWRAQTRERDRQRGPRWAQESSLQCRGPGS